MRYNQTHSETTKKNVLEAATREFKSHGFSGIGIDGLAKAANVSSGAFYTHFKSKVEAFNIVTKSGLEKLSADIQDYEREHGSVWLPSYLHFYLSPEHIEDIANGCALAAFAPEMIKAKIETKVIFENELIQAAKQIASNNGKAGLSSENLDRTTAWPILAQLLGAIILSRAVNDPKLREEISNSVTQHMLATTENKI